ncbi:nucleotidyltransferase [Enterococcus faecium]|nr:nucleotidyltransferase [Enterococcus faecium]MCV6650572.1 nucleotidyltransferase [Enterococcus faecium]
MKSCGIIVEYNPFHNGHRYHVEMARKTTGAEVVIAVMSGNFLQRGEPAIIDKWHRANEALQNGVDLVVELPVEWAVQSADYFAKGAVKILQTLDCDSLCFGTEEETSFDYSSFGRFVQENQDRIEEAFQELSDQTYSYPQKMTEVFRSLYPDIVLDFSSPNHILGLSYAKENAKYVHPMELHPIRRKSAGYHEKIITDQTIASATAIRRHALEEGKRIAGLVPPQTEEDLSTCSLQTWESYWPYLRYRLLSSTLLELTDIYQMTEGIESRMKTAAATADSFEDFVSKVKTKRYTWTRIQRLSCYVLLNIKKQEIPVQQNKNYLRLLGFTDVGRRFLKEKKEISIYSRIGKKEAQEAELLVRSDQIYQLGGNIPEQNFGQIPIRV